MARVFSWIIETDTTAYVYITNGVEGSGETPIIRNSKLGESEQQFKQICTRVNKLTFEQYSALFDQMKALVYNHFQEYIIEGNAEDYYGTAEDYILLAGVDGKNGANGKDAVYYEYRYHLFADDNAFQNAVNAYNSCTTDAEKDAFIEKDWATLPQGISNKMTIEAMSQKKAGDKTAHWERPIVWSKWGRDGKDGIQLEYIYIQTVDERVRPEGFYKDNLLSGNATEDPRYQNDDYFPYSSINGKGATQWYDNPKGTTAENRAEWCSIRKKNENGLWGEFSAPVLWTRQPNDGLNVYLTNQSVDIFPNENTGELDYSNANTEIVVMNGINDLSSVANFRFEGFRNVADKQGFYTDGNIELQLKEGTNGRKEIQITKITKRGHSYINIIAEYQSLADSTTMDVELDFDGRIEVTFNKNAYHYEGRGKEAPIDSGTTIELTAHYYRGFTTNNTRWQMIDESGYWQDIAGIANTDILEVPYSTDLTVSNVDFWKGRDEIYIRRYGEIRGADGSVQETDYDSVSLFKLYDGQAGANGEGIVVVLSNSTVDVYPTTDAGGQEVVSIEDAVTTVQVYAGSEEITKDGFTLMIRDGEWKDYVTLNLEAGREYTNTNSINIETVKAAWKGFLSIPVEATYNGVKGVAAWNIDFDSDGNRIKITSNTNVFFEKDGAYNLDEIQFTASYVGAFNTDNTTWLVEDSVYNDTYEGYWKSVDAADIDSHNIFTLSREKYMNNRNSLRVRNWGRLTTNTAVTDYDEITVFKLRDGKDGENSAFAEYIYKLYTKKDISDEPNLPNTWEISQEDGFKGDVSYGWESKPQGINLTERYEFICVREKKKGQWGAFSEPTLWAAWGEKGTDGISVEYVYFLTKENKAPTVDAYDVTSDAYQQPEFLPSTENVKWADNPMSVSAEIPFQWVMVRKTKEGVWQAFSAPALWNRMARDGAKGERGAIYRYKGEFNNEQEYVHNAEYIDYVSFGNTMDSTPDKPMLQYYSLNQGLSGTGAELGGIPKDNPNWTPFFTAEAIATNFLLSDQVKANIIEASQATFDTLSGNTANVEKVLAQKIEANKANIEQLSAETINANSVLSQKIDAVDGKFQNLEVDHLYAEKGNESTGKQGAQLDATTFLLYYSGTTTNSKVYLQIMPEYTIPDNAEDVGAFAVGTKLKNVPVLVMEYTNENGSVKRFLDPFTSWKPYEKSATASFTWIRLNGYEGREGLNFYKPRNNIYVVKDKNGNLIKNSQNKVNIYIYDGNPLSTTDPSGSSKYSGTAYFDPSRVQLSTSEWIEVLGQKAELYYADNIANSDLSYIIPHDDTCISCAYGEDSIDPSSEYPSLIDSNKTPITINQMSFSKYTISNGAVSSMENENEYYLSCESYKSASSTSGTQAYFFRTTLTGSTSTINTQVINCNAVWTKTNISNISNISEMVQRLPQIEKPSVSRSANIYFATADDRVGLLGNPIGNNGVIAWDQSGSITYSLLVALTFNQ